MTKKKILIADDDYDFVEVLSDFLKMYGYDVSDAYAGLDAVEKIKEELPDLILLDWNMPEGKGPAVLEMIRESEKTKHIPVYILSGAEEAGMETTWKSLGAKGHIKKPFEREDLLTKIKNAIGE